MPQADPSQPKTQTATVDLPLPPAGGRPVLDHQARHDVVLQVDPPPVGTVIRFVAEADDRCARGAQTGRSSVLQFQVVSPDELFYEILIRQRAERAKFLAVLESLEKQTPVLAGPSPPSSEDFVRLARHEHATARQLDQIAGRIADTLQEMKLNQVGSPKSHRLLARRGHRPDPGARRRPHERAARRASRPSPNSGQARQRAWTRLDGCTHEVVTRMKNILEQMSQWESFVDVVNQVAEVIRMQQKVLQATEKARESRAREVFDGKP